MERNRPTTYTSFLAVLVVLTVLSVKMAFLYASELLALLLISVPGILIVVFTGNESDRFDA